MYFGCLHWCSLGFLCLKFCIFTKIWKTFSNYFVKWVFYAFPFYSLFGRIIMDYFAHLCPIGLKGFFTLSFLFLATLFHKTCLQDWNLFLLLTLFIFSETPWDFLLFCLLIPLAPIFMFVFYFIFDPYNC
jgi:hypothetical protein